MGYGSFNRVIKSAAGVAWDGSASFTATSDSEVLNLNGFRRVCLWVDCGVSSGTSPTLDPKIQFSPDAGTTWVDWPAAANAQTAQGITQITESNDDAAHMEYYEHLPQGPDVRYKLVLTLGGSSTPTITLLEVRIIAWDRVDGSV